MRMSFPLVARIVSRCVDARANRKLGNSSIRGGSSDTQAALGSANQQISLLAIRPPVARIRVGRDYQAAIPEVVPDAGERTGVVRPLSSMPGRMNKRKLPRGILVNHDDLAALAGQPNQVADACQSIDVEIVSLKRQVCYISKNIVILKFCHISCGYICSKSTFNYHKITQYFCSI
ncbi:unnamed protein product [Trichogramma brassicae]|uniref:Uncharacterized protein n=1 Tax=Trichogramma brassicae TaxID=86971 RepID=A0A6H5HZV9_9HYME|nr:unnamed protein product [Trichogramma brassicae]